MQLYQQKHLSLKRKLPPSKHPVYSNNNVRQKKFRNQDITKELLKTHAENDKQTIKGHSTSIDIKTIRNYPLSTGTYKQTQR